MLQIFDKLRRWWRPEPPPKQGPRRIKNYSAQTGFQYRYHLEISLPGDYGFVVWTATHSVRSIRITVPLPGLSPRDRYALAKLRLFQSFDEHQPTDLPEFLEVKSTAALDELSS